MPQSGIVPSAAVLVTTVRSMKNQGEGDLERGLPNLGKHIEILKNFGVPIVAAINRFPDDSESELKRLTAYCGERGLTATLSEGYAKGGPGAKELAQRAEGVKFSEVANANLKQFSDWGYGKLPVCMAKTQYSLSDNPKLLGAPRNWTLNVTNASLSAGAGFVVVISGNVMLMPGLPKVSRAASIDVDDSGRITGI